MKRLLFASAICFLLGSSGAFADEPPWKAMKPFCLPEYSIGGEVYKPGVAAIKLEYRYTKNDKLYQGSSHIDHPGVGPASIRQQLFFLGFRYGIIDRVDFRIQLPLLFMDIKDAAGTSLANPNGIGDVGALVRYQILNPTNGVPFFMSLGLGFGAPTGSTDANGAGTGAWDFYSELTFSYIWTRQRIDAELFFGLRGDGEHDGVDTSKGNFAKGMFFYGFAINHYFDVGLDGIVQWVGRDSVNHVDVENSGGTTVYLGPVVHLKWLRHKTFLSFSIPFSIYRDVNGAQLTTDWFYNFFFKCKF
jgi:hypothetical protein